MVYEGTVELHFEDGGMALISDNIDSVDDPHTFVRLHSWNEDALKQHPELQALQGRRVRVTVEILPTKRKR